MKKSKAVTSLRPESSHSEISKSMQSSVRMAKRAEQLVDEARQECTDLALPTISAEEQVQSIKACNEHLMIAIRGMDLRHCA